MSNTFLVLVVLALALAPLAHGHDPAGTLKLYCEPPSEWKTHDYGPPASRSSPGSGARLALLSSGFVLGPPVDGNLDDCDGDFDPTNPVCWAEELTREDADGDGLVCEAFDYDEHPESASRGAWIISCDELCGDDGLGNPGSGSLICFGSQSHHVSLPTVRVLDNSGLSGIEFRIAADTVSLTGPDSVDGTVCGDFHADVFSLCIDVCAVTFPPGLDGAYEVHVVGTAGHVITN